MTIKTDHDLEAMKRAGRVVAAALAEMKARVEPGMTTAELDAIGEHVLAHHGARSAPNLLYNFPGVSCLSVNSEAVHGIPGDRVLQPGDLVKIDVTAELGGYIADAAVTVVLPPGSAQARRLADSARVALGDAIAAARGGRPINVIGRAIERRVRKDGFNVLPELFSHGVGRAIHEDPSYPQYYDPRFRQPLREGLVITIEPIITAGKAMSAHTGDGWTIATADGALSAHHEHTVVITRGRPIVLTAA